MCFFENCRAAVSRHPALSTLVTTEFQRVKRSSSPQSDVNMDSPQPKKTRFFWKHLQNIIFMLNNKLNITSSTSRNPGTKTQPHKQTKTLKQNPYSNLSHLFCQRMSKKNIKMTSKFLYTVLSSSYLFQVIMQKWKNYTKTCCQAIYLYAKLPSVFLCVPDKKNSSKITC